MMPQGVALVTGGAKRIGRAIACDLAGQGWPVGVHFHHSKNEANTVVAKIMAAGGTAVALDADLTDPTATEALIGQATAELGPVTALINNASAFERDSITDFPTKRWDGHLDINLRAPAILTKAFATALPENLNGNIINLIDQRVWNLTSEFLSYSISKFGLWGLTQMSAIALAPKIRVNGIGPGPVLPSTRQSAEDFARQSAATPLGHGADPQEICDAISYILGARSVTGQMIALDGGAHMTWNTDSAAPLE